MDPVRNPFAPGAGNQPPELAGRGQIVEDARIALQRAILGRSARSQMLLGLRGVGKTVLLNKIEQEAQGFGHETSFIEAPEDRSLAELIFPKIHQTLRRLSLIEAAKAKSHAALRALRAFAAAFKLKIAELEIAVDAEPGVADSGNLEFDLTDLFLRVGEAAQAAGRGWTLLLDEVQYLNEVELAALIVALHKSAQKGLPVLFFGAGLPQTAALAGDAKSYAERLFQYPDIGPLPPDAARQAILAPILEEGEEIDEAALALIVAETNGYPYYLQEWGFQAWNLTEASPITAKDIDKASLRALQRLDEGFFKVRIERLTPKERDYVIAMARLGKGPYRSAEVAEVLKAKPTSLGPIRASIIRKGMIYSPAHGDIAFTVPLFEDYLARHFL
ncbi:AAA family ATPase [Neogemmobacter tilapiae]|uniref:ATPase n=1 Tax=Neogemmobacter tilapiae TaxID=875041 RepID=A0A918TUX8_9RHOB|nr:ATP-binding protein [Gemmobacter tilapiae]GHC63894.1 ATPase [Gemmobacter tilapiae]